MAQNYVSNSEFALAVAKANPAFRDILSKVSSDYAREHGFDVSTATDIPREKLYDFIGLSLRMVFVGIDLSTVHDPFTDGDFGVQYNETFGAFLQKIAVNPITEQNPLYMNLQNNGSIDPWKISKPDVTQRFFEQNDNFQASVTLQNDGFLQQVFINPNGISELVGAIMQQLNDTYSIHNVEMKLEGLNGFINSTKFPLKDTQKVTIDGDDTPTSDDVINTILAIKRTITAVTSSIRTGVFNAAGFKQAQRKEDLRLLVRQGFKDQIDVKGNLNSYNQEFLNVGVPVIELPNFGGISYYKEKELTTLLTEHYDENGRYDGLIDPADTTKTLIQKDQAFEKDPNANVYALLVDKNALVLNNQLPLTIEPSPYNAAGMYTTYWANKPNGTVRYDSWKNLVEFITPLK